MQTAQRTPQQTYRATFARFSWLSLTGMLIAFGILLVTVHPKHSAPESLLTTQLPWAAMTAVFLSFFVQLGHCRVIASPSALIVVHPIRRYVFPWGQVADVVVLRDGGMRIILRDGSTFAVFCFGGSVAGLITGGIHARKARDGIKAAMPPADSSEPASPALSSLDLEWKITLTIFAALTPLAVIGWILAPHHVLA